MKERNGGFSITQPNKRTYNSVIIQKKALSRKHTIDTYCGWVCHCVIINASPRHTEGFQASYERLNSK